MYSCITTPEMKAAIDLSGKLGKLPEIFSLRDVYHRGWTGLGNPSEVRDALEILADSGWVRPLFPELPPPRGRQSERLQINPKVTHG
jgi:hypothetical protein